MIKRTLFEKISKRINTGKAIILLGPRQVGKTTLLKEVISGRDHLFLDGDDPSVRNILAGINTEGLKSLIGRHKLVYIDEVQRIEGIWLTLKIITDQFKEVQLLVSGSSAFEINNMINEPLTGRKWEYQLFPVSWSEFEENKGYLIAEQQLELRLIYGMYPDVINSIEDSAEVLKQLVNSFLFRDLLSYSGIRKPEVLEKLVRALAFQIGNEVSYNELAQLCNIDKNTVSNYIDLLEQGYVIYRLKSFSKNLRNEIKTNHKIYFYDNGVRNAVMGNLNAFDSRADKGQLWENFLITERIKELNYAASLIKPYFWRTTTQQEVDYVEDDAGIISGYEIKLNPNAKVRIPKTFGEAYNTKVEVVNRNNFRDFLKL